VYCCYIPYKLSNRKRKKEKCRGVNPTVSSMISSNQSIKNWRD
jgi:hypothetical protein